MRSKAARATSATMIGLLALLTLGYSPAALASGERLVVNVPEPFEVNGRVFPAGRLAVRYVRDLNPATAIAQVSVGTECLGMLLAQRKPNDPSLMAGSVVFARSPKGHLTLVGYTTSGHSTTQLFVNDQRDRRTAPTGALLAASR